MPASCRLRFQGRLPQLGAGWAALVLAIGSTALLFGEVPSRKDNVRALFQKARASERAGEWSVAEDLYRLLLKQEPASPEAMGNLGAVLARQERYAEAIPLYEKALGLNPALFQLHLNMGLAYYKTSRPQSALPHFRSYLAEDPTSKQARQLLANTLLELDRYEESAREFEALLPTGDLVVQLGRATAYLRLGRVSEAQPLLEDLLRNENSAEIQLLLGQAHLASNRYSEAMLALRKSLELNPGSWAHIYLGATHWKLQDVKSAILEWREALKIDPNSFEVTFVLGAALAETSSGRDGADEAWTLLEQARRMRPQHGSTLYHLGKLAWKASRPQDAKALLLASVEYDPNNRYARYLLSQVYRSLGNLDEARQQLEIAKGLYSEAVTRDRDIFDDLRDRRLPTR